MKKSILKIAGILAAISMVSFFAGCSSDDDEKSTKPSVKDPVVVTEECDHELTREIVETAPSFDTKGLRKFICESCNEEVDSEEIPALGLCESPVDAETYKPATRDSKFIYFGVFPKTVLDSASGITVDETVSTTNTTGSKLYRCNYYKGSDGYWYAKVNENAYLSGSKYSDGSDVKVSSANSTRYFKVEPIKWQRYRTYETAHPFSYFTVDIINAGVPFFDRTDGDTNRDIPVVGVGNTKNNNYEYSQIRAYLNNLSYYCIENTHNTVVNNDYIGSASDLTSVGFSGKAFTDKALDKLVARKISNDANSTKKASSVSGSFENDNACNDTTDKVFLLSIHDATNTDMDFDQASRLRVATDYAKANHAQTVENDGKYYGIWMTRSPTTNSTSHVYIVDNYGNTNNDDNYKTYVEDKSVGIIPVITLDLSAESHVHSFVAKNVISEPTLFTTGKKECECSCGVVKTIVTPELYASPVDADTNEAATSSSQYVYFGIFPKTVLSSENESIITSETVTMGANTYYKGTDGNWYVKAAENRASEGYKFSDDSLIRASSSENYRYFKVEPIKWKVVTSTYGKTAAGKDAALLVAADILTGNVPYYSTKQNRSIGGATVYPNNYKYSSIRAYLNGKYEADDVQNNTHSNKGFLQTAFTATARSCIASTKVINNGNSTTDATGTLKKADGSVDGCADYTCADTKDKIFLLSESEVTTTSYGFKAYNSEDTARVLKPTDYAFANHARKDTVGTLNGGEFWLRSPRYSSAEEVHIVNWYGCAKDEDIDKVDDVSCGVVPALAIVF